ncbi:uncharacterized protein LOC120411264 [Corvus cornix cornix]|uniref:uncharacterized protein LOC120411264 n=1 Tax=Corvus cornix cornix TaxID=932674 RepID=UPI00194FAEFC|nr:uncharacterized protein LOC120411264 [Corvus cornix cornix]XP_039421030.1 uncharacterized protein LOC120411264 [Corvus cornix cornix]
MGWENCIWIVGMLMEVKICQIQRSLASHSRVDLASGASSFLASSHRYRPAPHPLSHIWKSGIWKGEQRGRTLTEMPSREFKSRILFPGQDSGGSLLRGRSCGKQPDPLPLSWPRSPRDKGFAAKNEKHRLGGSPGEWEQVGSHGADPNPPTVPGEQTAPPALRARLLPKGNKHKQPFLLPVGAGTVPPSHRAQGSRWRVVVQLERSRDSPLGSSCASVPIHAMPNPAFPNFTPHPPSWAPSLVPWAHRSQQGMPLKGQFGAPPLWVKPFRALPVLGEYLGEFPLLFLPEGVTPGAPALTG